MLIGRQNETLSALEFVTRLMVNQQVRTRTNFVVDVNGYRAKRAESLRKLALRMADQVAESGRTVALEPMPPAERRIIHLALRDHPTRQHAERRRGRPPQGHPRAEEVTRVTQLLECTSTPVSDRDRRFR